MAGNRQERQGRRGLDPVDFERLAAAGFLRIAVPEEMGGLWRGVAETTRPICEVLRMLAAADPSVALVASMHPAVVSFWLTRPDETQPKWTEQRQAVFATAVEGGQWGTITSEPGSGGDILRTKSQATPRWLRWLRWPGAGRRVPGHRRQALRQRFGGHVVHGHHRGPRWRGRAGHLHPRRPRPPMGRIIRAATDCGMGRDGHGRDPEPCHAARGLPRHPPRVGRTTRGDLVRGRPTGRRARSRR